MHHFPVDGWWEFEVGEDFVFDPDEDYLGVAGKDLEALVFSLAFERLFQLEAILIEITE